MFGSDPVQFSLYSTSCGTGNQGSITALISQGTPPFTFNWSPNVSSNPQQITVNNLTGGTYSLVIQDANNCSFGALTTIECSRTYVSFQTYTMGSDEFVIVSPTKCGIIQILNDGFADLTSGFTGCVLVNAEYIAKVQVQPQGTVLTNSFYNGTSLIDVPSDNLWYTTIENMLESIVGIVDVVIDPLNNQITIIADPSSSIIDQQIIVELVIVYDIECESSAPPTPSPTATPTITPSITPSVSVTPSVTPTKSVTPSVTPSTSVTPTVTPTKTLTPTPSMTPGLNLSTPFFYEVSYDSLPVITTNSIANAAAAKTLICDFWGGSAQTSTAYGSNFANPLNVGTYVGLSTTPGTGPMFAGNYIVGNFTTVTGPTSVNYWVVIDGSGFVTEYTLIDPNC
jgi:hypothetical protein